LDYIQHVLDVAELDVVLLGADVPREVHVRGLEHADDVDTQRLEELVELVGLGLELGDAVEEVQGLLGLLHVVVHLEFDIVPVYESLLLREHHVAVLGFLVCLPAPLDLV